MITIGYSGKSRLSAQAIADEGEFELVRSGSCLVNWGRRSTRAVLNANIKNSVNKRKMRELFREHGVPMPNLVSISDLRSDLARGVPRMVIGRPDRHSRKRGFWLCRTSDDVRKALRGTRKKKAATHFMEYVNADREYRVHVFKGMSIRISEKEFGTDGKYTTVKPRHRIGRVRSAAKQAVEALGLDFGAVDILAKGENNEEVFVLEVNAAPGLGGSTPKLYANAFKRWEQGIW